MKQIVLHFEKIHPDKPDTIAFLMLHRPEIANAFSAEMMNEIVKALEEIEDRATCRAAVICGKGKHFSGGADLNWMKHSATLSFDENVRDANLLTRMFETLVELRIPTVAFVRGSAYGGAVGLTAGCDFAVATNDAKFCLSEMKLGIMPAVIAPYLMRKISRGQLRRLALSAKVFSAQEAKEVGLVEVTCEAADAASTLRDELNRLLMAGPKAQSNFKDLLDVLDANHRKQTEKTAEAIARIRTGLEGQTGLNCFFEKSVAPWVTSLPENWIPPFDRNA